MNLIPPGKTMGYNKVEIREYIIDGDEIAGIKDQYCLSG